MSELEKINLIKKVQNNSDKESLELLISTHKNLIWKIAKKYNLNKRIDINDIIQEGYIGFIESIHLFNSATRTIKVEAEFHYFASIVIRNKILKFICKQNSECKYNSNLNFELEEVISPERVENNLKPFIYNHINKCLTLLESLIIKWRFGLDNGTWYTTEEIAKISSFSVRRIDQIIQISLKKLKFSIEKESKSNNKNLFLGN